MIKQLKLILYVLKVKNYIFLLNKKKKINKSFLLLLAYYNKGVALFDQGDFLGAIKCYDKLIELKPNFALAYNKTDFRILKVTRNILLSTNPIK